MDENFCPVVVAFPISLIQFLNESIIESEIHLFAKYFDKVFDIGLAIEYRNTSMQI
jgi:hypothetical protein